MRRGARYALRGAVFLYRLALLRYPRWLRRRHGADMMALFEAWAAERLDREGLRGLGRTCWANLRDLLRPLPGPIAATASLRAIPRRSGTSGGGAMRPSSTFTRLLDSFRADAAFATRSLVREPRFSGLVIGVLAVGIALNVMAFAVLNAYLLRPLPYPDADRVVSVRGAQGVSWSEVDDVFEAAVSWDLDVFTLLGDGRPHLARGAWITPDFLDVYGVRAQLGRTFNDNEAGRDGAPVAMISNDLWRTRFGGNPEVVGATFRAFTSDRPEHAELFTIVGVLPEDFWHLNEYTDVLAPIRTQRAVYGGRLRPDVPIERAEAFITERSIRNSEQLPPDFSVQLIPVHDAHVAAVRPTLLVLQGASLLVLLIACANAGVLFLVRSARRARELGVRRALGASGPRLARQLVVEGVSLVLVAGTLGAALAAWGLARARDFLEARLGATVPGGAESLTVDGTVLLATAVACALVGIGFGLVPLFTSGVGPLSFAIGSGRRGSTESKRQRRTRGVMVTAEVALSLALLTGSGLMLRSALHLQNTDLGFHSERIVQGVIGLREASYPTAEERVDFFSRLADRLDAVPDLESVAFGSSSPFGMRFITPTAVEGQTREGSSHAEAVTWLVGEDYFDALGVDLRRGRVFTREDAAGAEAVAVVSASAAEDLWGDADPIGRLLRAAGPNADMTGTEPGPWHRVVGVVGDVARGVADPEVGDLYTSYRQAQPRWLTLFARHRPGAPSAVPHIEQAIEELDPDVPFSDVVALDTQVQDAMAPTRYLAGLFTGFAAFSLVLAVIGLYGVISYAARQRKRDIAIRVALGADRSSVTRLFVRQGLVVVTSGVAFGWAGGYVLGQALRSQLHGVAPGDPFTYLTLTAILGITATLAVWLPARQAASADPMAVLGEE